MESPIMSEEDGCNEKEFSRTIPFAYNGNIHTERTDEFLPWMMESDQATNCSKRFLKKPRRSLSAYNIFFNHQRNQIIKERMDLQPQCRSRMSFSTLARMIAARWKAIDSETRGKYEELAAKDARLYKRKIDEWSYLTSACEDQSVANSYDENLASVITPTINDDNVEIQQYGSQWSQSKQNCETQSLPDLNQQMLVSVSDLHHSEVSHDTVPLSPVGVSMCKENFVTDVDCNKHPHESIAVSMSSKNASGLIYNTIGQTSRTNFLSDLAEKLGHESLELLLQIFGLNSQHERINLSNL